jgi:hypothetical protein
VIAVIAELSRLEAKNYPVHHRASMVALCVERLRTLVPKGIPVPRHQADVFGSVYDGDLALSERDEFDRLIKRLDNRLAHYATFGHDLTSNEIAVFDRVSIVAGGARC